MTRALITCKELMTFLDGYVDETLSPEERAEFDRHLALCPSCVDYLQGYRTTIVLGRRAFDEPEAPAPEDVPADLVRAILEARRRP